MLTQSLMQSASRVYAAAWHAAAAEESARLDVLTDAQCDAELAKMEQAALSALLLPVNKRFQAAFEAIAQSGNELLAAPEVQSASMKRAPTATPRPR